MNYVPIILATTLLAACAQAPQKKEEAASPTSNGLKDVGSMSTQTNPEYLVVILNLHVLANGSVDDAVVETTSGDQEFDSEMVSRVKQGRMQPASKNGVPIDSWYAIQVRQRLADK